MTTFQSKFALGDKAYTVSLPDLRIVELTVGKISCSKTAERDDIYVHPMKENGQPDWNGYPEESCFKSREQLLNHLNGLDITTDNF